MPENLESSRPWSVYYSGPKGQRNRPSGSKVNQRFRGEDFTGTLQTTSFLKAPPIAHPTVHAELCVSQRRPSWQICYHTCALHQACNRCVLSSTGCLPAQQEKTLLSVGCGQRTRKPRHICGALYRTIYLISACGKLTAPPYSLIREYGLQEMAGKRRVLPGGSVPVH